MWDGVFNDGVRVAIGITTRRLIYGVGASLAWKGFDFICTFRERANPLSIYGKTYLPSARTIGGNVMKGMFEDRWVDAETAALLVFLQC
jgi:hypothetical protein